MGAKFEVLTHRTMLPVARQGPSVLNFEAVDATSADHARQKQSKCITSHETQFRSTT